ncbi:copine-3-like [Gigantopelta aegis]|uniref:copine-3-like n=1 Tax=Gigantopelta aegis TaxID=1735272 RepID=UPI001B88803F|nr:copine-3-like [Gigantopelta aegis]
MAYTFKGGKVELMISCQNLANLDVFTKTDPMCVLFVKQFGQWKEFGRTEAIRESLNPGFTESFIVDFEPDIQQSLLFSVYDIDSRSNDLRNHDFVGSVELVLESLVDLSKPWTTTTRVLRVAGDPKPRGLMNITAELIKQTKGKVQFHIAGHKLGKVGLFAKKPDAYLEIGREINSVTYQPIFRTEVQYKSREPWWRPWEIGVQKLCNDQWDRSIQFSCWHSNYGGIASSPNVLLGVTTTTLRELDSMKSDHNYKRLDLKCPKKEKKKKNAFSGSLRFYQYREPSGGVALLRIEREASRPEIDLWREREMERLAFESGLEEEDAPTWRAALEKCSKINPHGYSSNGEISDKLSLHSTCDARNNQYLNTIESLGALIARYDVEQKVALFGFGAKTTAEGNPKTCFPILDKNSNIWVKGIKGAVKAYNAILPTLQFSGPTYIAPAISTVSRLIKDEKVTQDRQIYYVLLVLTDGVINDIDATVHELISTSSLPLSVIITGIGPADFTLMEQFHTSVNKPLTDERTRKSAERPNVHFVSLKKDSFTSGGGIMVIQEAFAALSVHVTQYLKKKNISPNKAKLMKLDPLKGWVNPTTRLVSEDDQFGDIKSPISTKSLRPKSAIVDSLTGPTCPTCGSYMAPGASNGTNGAP